MSELRLYRVSALASGFVRMWRAWTVIVTAVIANAALQALLVWPPFTYSAAWWTYLSALLSGVVFGLTYGLIVSAALQVPQQRVSFSGALSVLRTHFARYAMWAVIWLVAITVGLALNVIVGLLVAALTPFLLLAALDGQGNVLMRNLRTIGHRFWRWLITVVIMGTILMLANLGSGVFIFFIRNPLAALVVWLVGGIVLTWFTTAWALIYRSAWAD